MQPLIPLTSFMVTMTSIAYVSCTPGVCTQVSYRLTIFTLDMIWWMCGESGLIIISHSSIENLRLLSWCKTQRLLGKT